jgi:hypothetical protein
MQLIVLIISSLILSACAMPGGSIGSGTAQLSERSVKGTTYDYSQVSPDVVLQGNLGTVAFAVFDNRPFVATGEQSPATVGAVQPEKGRQVVIATASGAPFAQDVSLAVQRLLDKNGIPSKPLVAAQSTSLKAAENLLLLEPADRHTLLVIHQWGTDTFLQTTLVYDLELLVTDRAGALLASRRINGSESLGRSTDDPLSVPQNRAAPALRAKLQQLFGAPDVAAVL